MPRKKPEFADEPKEEKYEEVWDLKKVIIGIIVLLLLILGTTIGLRLYLHQSISPSSFVPHFTSVQGTATGPTSAPVHISLPSAQDVQGQIQTIQQQVSNLNVAEIASTSPQIQAVLKQIENIPSGPESQVKDACQRLCNNL